MLSTDTTKPYGPTGMDGVIKDTFADTRQINLKKSKFIYDSAARAVRPPKRAKDLPKMVANNQLVTVAGTAYEIVKKIEVRLMANDKDKKFAVKFSLKGKARLTVKDEAGTVHFSKERMKP